MRLPTPLITRLLRRARRVAALALLRAAAAALASGTLAALPSAAFAQPDPYKQHMENGVKLFQDKNYQAALVEFEAAYKVRPKARPLFNVALCQKALFRYPRAIAALELALARHRDTMDQGDEGSARRAIEEMRALLARITVQLTPPHATLMIDGEEQPVSSEGTRVVELGPGTHRIGARAEGFASVDEAVTVVSGEVDRTLSIALKPDKGYVVVDAVDPQAAIAVDQQFAAHGRWAGYLPPGIHLVQIYRPGDMIYAAHVLVAAGKSQEIRPGQGGVPATGPAAVSPLAPLPAVPPPPPKPAKLRPERRGPFVLGTGSLLWPLDHPKDFPEPELNSGAAGALRVGYQVNTAASFDVMLQYVNIATHSKQGDAKYTFEAGRLGLNLRLMTPGQTFRLVGSLGGGIAYDTVSFNLDDPARCPADKCFDASGVDPFVLADLGVELDFGGALLGFSLESYFQSSRGIDAKGDRDLYDARALIHLGGSLRVGYAFF